MTGFSIFSIPFVGKACNTPRKDRTELQSVLVACVNAWLYFKGRMPWNAQKYDATIFRGQVYHESLCDYRTLVLYDREGYLYGWHGQDREGLAFFQTWEDVHPGEPQPRMRMMSRLLSPKLSVDIHTEIIGQDGLVIGYTDYSKVN